MKPWNFVLRPRIRNYNVITFDTEELPSGDFVLWLAIKDLPETARYFVNPSAKFVQTLIKKTSLDVAAQKYDFMRLYLYLSRLTFKRKGYRLMYSSLESRWCLRRELKKQLSMVKTATFYKLTEVKEYE